MIKIENTKVTGWDVAITGMRNPKNSWKHSDTKYIKSHLCTSDYEVALAEVCGGTAPLIGPNDLKLMMTLVKAGTDHRKFMRFIKVTVDITAPLYWWKEFDTYKVGTIANSCSTMHKIAEKEFSLEDFSCEHLNEDSIEVLRRIVDELEANRKMFLVLDGDEAKHHWLQMIQLLPSSYNQRRTVELNYEVLANMYRKTSRRYHKLDEWNVNHSESLCHWITRLPYSELITYTPTHISEVLHELSELASSVSYRYTNEQGIESLPVIQIADLSDIIEKLRKKYM